MHQRPTVALLCGPHVQGAQGVSCGRHLANHEVEVILFLPNFVKMIEAITNELTLFNKTGGKQVSSLKGIASKHVSRAPIQYLIAVFQDYLPRLDMLLLPCSPEAIVLGGSVVVDK